MELLLLIDQNYVRGDRLNQIFRNKLNTIEPKAFLEFLITKPKLKDNEGKRGHLQSLL